MVRSMTLGVMLEPTGNGRPRGMIAHYRTRLTVFFGSTGSHGGWQMGVRLCSRPCVGFDSPGLHYVFG
jgi:hypothetical protein